MMTKRLLHIVHTEASCGWGGQEIRILSESEGMIARGHRVTLLCSQSAPMLAEAKERGINVVGLPMEKKTLKGLIAIRNWFRTHQDVDVVNTHSSTDSWLVALSRLTLSQQFAIVRTRHVSVPVSNKMATRWLYQKGCDAIVTTGERLKQTLVRDNGFDPDRIQSITTGISPERFFASDKTEARALTGIPSEPFIIGIVATLRSWKGHKYLLQAVSKIQAHSWHLVIVGDGPQNELLKVQVASLNLSEKVTFAGNQKDVVPWLRSMDLFVLPSYANEGVPQSMMQAMFTGIPVIGTPVGSVDEILLADQTGLMVPPQDVEALGDAIVNLMENKELRLHLAEQALIHVKEHYSFQHMIDRMSALFLRLVE